MKNIPFALLLLTSFWIYAQPQIEKKMVLHFEDGIGNTDSIILLLNWTENCNPDNVWPFETYPELGEIPITKPFDSEFEVRAAKDLGGSIIPSHIKDAQFKTLTICDKWWSNEEVDALYSIYFIPRIKHLPLKMFWDFTWLQEKKQLDATWFTNDYTWVIYDGNIEYVVCCLDDDNFYDLSICASEQGDTIVFDSLFLPIDTFGNVMEEAAYVNEIVGDNQIPFPFILKDSLDYDGGKFFPIFFHMLLQKHNSTFTMCNTEVGIAETELPFEVIITQQSIIVNNAYASQIENITIFNLNSKALILQKRYNKPIAIEHLQRGLYVFVVNDKLGQVFSKKFVKL